MSTESISTSLISAALRSETADRTVKYEDTGFADLLAASSGAGGTDLDAIFEAAAQKYGISVSLLKAVAKIESGFRPDATSPCGAMGIMQLMPGTASALGVTDAYDPEQNIMGGAKFLKQMLDSYGGDVQLALAAYNAGPGNVNKYGGIPPFKETQNYVRKVMESMDGGLRAGSVTYSSLSGSSRAPDTGASSSGSGGGLPAASGMAEIIFMKIMELQMRSGKKDDDRAIP